MVKNKLILKSIIFRVLFCNFKKVYREKKPLGTLMFLLKKKKKNRNYAKSMRYYVILCDIVRYYVMIVPCGWTIQPLQTSMRMLQCPSTPPPLLHRPMVCTRSLASEMPLKCL